MSMGPTPKDIDISDGLSSTFGCVEFEKAMCEIVKFLQDDSSSIIDLFHQTREGYVWGEDLGPGEHPEVKRDVPLGWDKLFRLGDIPGVSHEVMAALAASGWIQHHWFPKWTFRLTPEAFYRILNHHQKKETTRK
jgi:hypothetical protein